MYAYLRGKLAVKNPTSVVLDLAGVGYEVSIPLSTFDHLPEVGGEVFLYIYPCYRPENVTLCGFATKEEKLLFNLLLGVNGVGPKLGLTILSGTTAAHFRDAIISGDDKTLCAISGIGKKLSQRLITELKDQIINLEESLSSGIESSLEKEAIGALVTLGYSRAKAYKAIQDAMNSKKSDKLEPLIKEALKRI